MITKLTLLERNPMYNLERELKIRKYSPKTIKAYLYYNKELLRIANKSSKDVNSEDIKNYLLILEKKGLSSSSLNTVFNALKFYYFEVLKRRFFFNKNLVRAKKDKKLPVVLSKEEVAKILRSILSVKHKLIIAVVYSSGLRVSEITALKVKDMNFDNATISIRGAKGKKDRITILSEKVLKILQKYIKNKSANDFVFESGHGGRLTERTVQKIFEKALTDSGIKKQASVHSLRHSFATHLLESGVDIRYIQALLGHTRLETTQIYTKVATDKLENIKSPLDLA